jgi:hypothetical protein
MVPVVVDWPGTVIAVNVGGALIPALMSLYLVTIMSWLWLLTSLTPIRLGSTLKGRIMFSLQCRSVRVPPQLLGIWFRPILFVRLSDQASVTGLQPIQTPKGQLHLGIVVQHKHPIGRQRLSWKVESLSARWHRLSRIDAIASDGGSPVKKLGEVIALAKQEIAEAAGVPVERVKISIDA